MLRILVIMLFGYSIKLPYYALYSSHYAPILLHLFLFTTSGARLTATFYLHAKSDTFRALSLSRIAGAEIGFSSPVCLTHGLSQLTHH